MRRYVGIGLMLLALAGCETLPAVVRIDVDGSTLEFKKKVPPAPEPPVTEAGNSTDAPAP
jgi:hypothetical protein